MGSSALLADGGIQKGSPSPVTGERLELRTHDEDCCRDLPEGYEDFARRAEIHLFPPVPSQGEGTTFLDRAEVSILDSAREAALLGHNIPEALRVGWAGTPLSEAM